MLSFDNFFSCDLYLIGWCALATCFYVTCVEKGYLFFFSLIYLYLRVMIVLLHL